MATEYWLRRAKIRKGTFGRWCKQHGHRGVNQACINHAARVGGRAAKMALFAANVSRGKYRYPG